MGYLIWHESYKLGGKGRRRLHCINNNDKEEADEKYRWVEGKHTGHTHEGVKPVVKHRNGTILGRN